MGSVGRAAAGLVNQLGILRTPDVETNLGRATQLLGYVSTAREAAQRYREQVLAHPDLCRRLCDLLGSHDASHWNGYVPPRTDRSQATGVTEYNPSPYRAQLVAIVIEALQRSGDWRQYDSDRLASVPSRFIRAPWAEPRGGPPASKGQEGLWPESGQ